MAISYGVAGATVYSAASGTTINIAYPAGISAGNLIVVVIASKPSSANGWGLANLGGVWDNIYGPFDGGGYGATLGADTGNIRLYVYTKVADGTETGTVLYTQNSNNVMWGKMIRFANATGQWDLGIASGDDITAGIGGMTFTSNPGLTVGDWVLGVIGIPTDVTGATGQAVTATGATFAVAVEIEEQSSTAGNDIGGFIIYSSVTAGTASANPAMTTSHTGVTTNLRGPIVLLRMREAAAAAGRRRRYYSRRPTSIMRAVR